MIGVLSQDEIEGLLRRNSIGRIGCSVGDHPYVVPIHYTYDGSFIYAYSGPGRKIAMMREQPCIAFQVDEIQGWNAWRSVVVEGRYEELTDPDARATAIDRLTRAGAKLVPKSTKPNGHLVLFRLQLAEKSGRFEERDH
jgi:nitroimidazol reductase NimA-like FMN-containing flavoprotein (pyridoxamine 5'-phosphate oxidase superfamily)